MDELIIELVGLDREIRNFSTIPYVPTPPDPDERTRQIRELRARRGDLVRAWARRHPRDTRGAAMASAITSSPEIPTADLVLAPLRRDDPGIAQAMAIASAGGPSPY